MFNIRNMEGEWEMFGVVVKISVNVYIYSPFHLKLRGSYAYFQEKAFRALEFCLLFHPYTYFLLKTWISQSYKERFAKKCSNYKSDDIDKLSA